MATFWELKTLCYKVWWIPSDSDDFDWTTIVWPKINEVVDSILKWNVLNLNDKNQLFISWDLPFARKTHFLTTIESQSLWTTLTTASTEVDFTTTNYPSSWAIEIEGDVINYTGKSSTQATWVTNISVWHTASSIIYPLFTLPNGISKPFTMFRVFSDWWMEEIDPVDHRFSNWAIQWYSIVSDDSWTEYIRIYGYDTYNLIIKMFYYIDYTSTTSWQDMSDDSDICIIPDKFARKIVPYISSWELLYEREEPETAEEKLNKWYSSLQEMYNYYNTQNKPNRRRIRVNSLSGNRGNGFETRHRIY